MSLHDSTFLMHYCGRPDLTGALLHNMALALQGKVKQFNLSLMPPWASGPLAMKGPSAAVLPKATPLFNCIY